MYLRGWVEAAGNKVYANDSGEYSIRIEKQDKVDIMAGYLDNNDTPASFITTARDVNGNINQNGLDVAVCSYLNLGQGTPEEVTPELFRVMAYEANFRPGGTNQQIAYHGAKALDKDKARWYLVKTSKKYGVSFSDEHWTELQRIIRDEINPNLKHPLPIVADETAYLPASEQEAQGMLFIQPGDISSIGYYEFNSDGIKDFVEVEITIGPTGALFGVHEEANSALVAANYVEDNRLAGKTILHEDAGPEYITEPDKKFQRFIECITYEVGQLKPKMSIDEVLKLPNTS